MQKKKKGERNDLSFDTKTVGSLTLLVTRHAKQANRFGNGRQLVHGQNSLEQNLHAAARFKPLASPVVDERQRFGLTRIKKHPAKGCFFCFGTALFGGVIQTSAFFDSQRFFEIAAFGEFAFFTDVEFGHRTEIPHNARPDFAGLAFFVFQGDFCVFSHLQGLSVNVQNQSLGMRSRL